MKKRLVCIIVVVAVFLEHFKNLIKQLNVQVKLQIEILHLHQNYK